MIVGLEARGREGAIETLLEQLGDLPAEMANEDELAIAGLVRDAREDLVVLRQILEQRLRAPIGRRIRPQPEFLAGDRRRRQRQRLVVKAGVGELHPLFDVMVLAVGGLDQFAAEERVEGRETAGLRMTDVAALHWGEAERRQLRGLGAHADV